MDLPSPRPFNPRSRPRTRTSSILSVASTSSARSAFSISSKTDPTTLLSQRPEKHEAYGSFVPLRSAAHCLRGFVSDAHYGYWKEYDDDMASPTSPTIPYITRTTPMGIPDYDDCPPSPNSASSIQHHLPPVQERHPLSHSVSTTPTSKSRLPPPLPSPSSSTGTSHRRAAALAMTSSVPMPDLHPILAKLEKKSKLCTKRNTCSTCGKAREWEATCVSQVEWLAVRAHRRGVPRNRRNYLEPIGMKNGGILTNLAVLPNIPLFSRLIFRESPLALPRPL